MTLRKHNLTKKKLWNFVRQILLVAEHTVEPSYSYKIKINKKKSLFIESTVPAIRQV